MKKEINLKTFPYIQELLQNRLNIICAEITYMERIISGIDKEKNASLYSEKRKNYTDSLSKMQAEYDEIMQAEYLLNKSSFELPHPFIPEKHEIEKFDRVYCGPGKIYESEDLNDC